MHVRQGLVVAPGDAPFETPLGKHMLLSEQSGGTVFAHAGRLDPGILIPPHTHSREDELLYVLEGDMTVELGDDIYRAPLGAVVWRPRGQRHALWNSADRAVRYFEVITPGGNFEAFSHEVARLLRAGADQKQIPEVARAHGIEFDMRHAGELIGRFMLHPVGG